MDKSIDEKLIIAKLDDKIRFCKTHNKIVNTDFLNLYQKNIIQKRLNEIKFKNYFYTGGFDYAESEVLIIYPEKLTQEIVRENINNIICAVRVILPNELKGKYEHRDYLGALMKIGLVRERIGDIIVYDDKAYILVLSENSKYIRDSLVEFTRFKKSKIDIIKVDEIDAKEPDMQEFDIHVNSMRLDSIVSEIAKVSRSKANELIESERVSINCKYEYKASKQVDIGDVLIIRGSGKYIIGEAIENKKTDRLIVKVKKYC